jgi:hypothetical protein
MAVQFRPGFIGGNPVTATTVTVVPDTITTLGLSLHWDANNTDSYSGGTTWTDLSGNGRNGTLVGSPGFATGGVGGRLTFNGTSQTVTVPNPLNQANLSQEWTVSAWINITEKVSQTLVSGLNSGLFVCYSQGNNSLLYLNSGGNDYYTYGGDLGTGGWVFATFRFRNSTGARTIFRNTTDISTGGPNLTSTPSGQAATFTIASGMEGQLGQLMMYNRYITDAEVIQNYTATRSRFLGYQNVTYTATADVTLTGNGSPAVTMFKNANNGVWNGEVRSTESFTAPCTIEFSKQAGATDNGVSYAMIGWNEDPTANTSYTSLDYAAYPYTTNNYSVYHNGGQVQFGGVWDPNKRFYVVYDTDGFIRHYNGSTLLYSVNYGTGKTVFVDSSLYSVNAITGGFTNVQVSRSSWNGAGYT